MPLSPSIVNFDHADGVDPAAVPRLARARGGPVALGRRATPSRTDRSVTRCLKTHHNYRGSPHDPSPRARSPAFFPRGWNTKQPALPCIRYERFYLWPPAPGTRRVMILFRPVLGIYAIGDSDKPRRWRWKKMKSPARGASGRAAPRPPRISPRCTQRTSEGRDERRGTMRGRGREKERERRIILFLHQPTRNSPTFYDRLTASLVR